MARPLRIQYENATYHIMNRGRSRQVVFPGPEYNQAFLQCLEEANIRYAAKIQAYCMMANHYHLLLTTPLGNLSRIMRHIDGVYTQRHNRQKNTDGALFRGRYKAILIDSSCYLLQVSRYIHRNPIETRNPQVDDLGNHTWSSYKAYINSEPTPFWLQRDAVFGELGSRKRYQAYRKYVEQGNNREITQFYGQKRIFSIMGSKEFKQKIDTRAYSMTNEISQREIQQPIPINTVIQQVASHYQISKRSLTKTTRGQGARNLPRWIAMKLCQQNGGAKLIDIANAFHVGHYSTVSQTIGRLNKLMLEDADLAKEFNMLSQDLTP